MEYDALFKKAKGILIEDILNYYNIPIVNKKICCLWHEDGRPSAHIYDESNVGYCFSCSKGSFDGIDIVMAKENMDFYNAMVFLTNSFTVSRTYIARQKKSLELYFKLDNELRNLVKQGADTKLIGRYGNMMDMFNENPKMLLRVYGILLKKINEANNVSKGNETQPQI